MRIRSIVLATTAAIALSFVPAVTHAAGAGVYTLSGTLSVTPGTINDPGSIHINAAVAKVAAISAPALPKQATLVTDVPVIASTPGPLKVAALVGTGIFTLKTGPQCISHGRVWLFLLANAATFLMATTSGCHKGAVIDAAARLKASGDMVDGEGTWSEGRAAPH